LLSLEQNKWSARINENNCRNKFICHPDQQMWCQNKSEQMSDTYYYYYSQNKFVCHLEQKKCQNKWEQLLEQILYSRNNFMCHLEQKQM
jgi:hypothetical protein